MKKHTYYVVEQLMTDGLWEEFSIPFAHRDQAERFWGWRDSDANLRITKATVQVLNRAVVRRGGSTRSKKVAK